MVTRATCSINAPGFPTATNVSSNPELADKPQDGQCRIQVSHDHLKAYLSLTPAKGGKPITRTDIFKAIVAAGISRGVINQCVSYALEKGACNQLLIAKGHPAKAGKDSEFESLLPKIRDRRPRIDDHGRAFYQDVGQLVTVTKGEPLVRRHPPAKGQDGFDVFGHPIASTMGQEFPFSPNLRGVAVDPDDPNVLLAAISGQPIIALHGVNVEPSIILESVDLNTGNISFDGSISITGNVCTGMTVSATGDILIGGMVEAAASVTAQGDISVKQGIIGRGAVSADNGEIGKGTAKINSGGNVSARFIENAWVRAGQSVAVEELIAHSDIKAANRVLAGNPSSTKGHIRGGIIVAQLGIQAKVLGSPADVATRLQVGDTKDLKQKLDQQAEIVQQQRELRQQLELRLAKICINPSGQSKDSSKEAISTLNREIHGLNQDMLQNQRGYLELKQQLDQLRQARIGCLIRAYPNIELTIADTVTKLEAERFAGEFSLDNQQINFTPK